MRERVRDDSVADVGYTDFLGIYRWKVFIDGKFFTRGWKFGRRRAERAVNDELAKVGWFSGEATE